MLIISLVPSEIMIAVIYTSKANMYAHTYLSINLVIQPPIINSKKEDKDKQSKHILGIKI